MTTILAPIGERCKGSIRAARSLLDLRESGRGMKSKIDRSVVSPIQSYLEALHADVVGLRHGDVATYIPELAKADPDWFGICIATTDGRLYEVGDSREPFTIQSISKAFIYGLALEDRGRKTVLEKIGVEPSGEAFNSISLAPGSGRPLNPMINAGAIAATSLVSGHSADDKLHRIMSLLSIYAGRTLVQDLSVYESERDTGHRNRAIGHMLRSFDILGESPDLALDLYFRQCSVSVDCRDLAMMAATLANGGTNPVSGERPIRPEFVQDVLSIMATCGMYDYAGEWVYWVGMPAKSGVAGGILAVLPGQLGIGIFSPPLDARGNSVRGVEVCRRMSRELNLHYLSAARPSGSIVRASYSLVRVGSKRVRSEADREALDREGDRARAYELQGDLAFGAVEAVARRIVDESPGVDLVVLDLSRVTQIGDAAAEVLLSLLQSLAMSGKLLIFASADRQARAVRLWRERLSRDGALQLFVFAEIDRALEFCENRLLGKSEPMAVARPALSLAEHPTLQGLSAEQIQTLEGELERRSYAAGELIVRRGEPADCLYFVARGEVSVTAELPNGQLKRLSTLSAGTTFGELAMVNRTPRSADVRADAPTDCYELSLTAFEALSEKHPDIKLLLLENLLRTLSRTAARLTSEVLELSR
jgi:glutaminase